jgi:hypothetical protein
LPLLNVGGYYVNIENPKLEDELVMASLGITIDPNEVQPVSFGTIPDSWQSVIITEDKTAPNQKGTGKLLTLAWEIQEGEYAGRKIWEQINYVHQNSVAQNIGQGRIMAIAKAVGWTGSVENTEVLWGKICRLHVEIEPAQGQYKEKNRAGEVKPYHVSATSPKQPEKLVSGGYQAPVGGAKPALPTTGSGVTQPTQVVTPPTGTTAPWRIKPAA